MELRHLRYFLAVADELHFGRAAERLGIAQPPLSQQIRRLEEELQVRLFERTKRRVTLTAAGRALRREAEVLVKHAGEAAEITRRAGRGEVGLLRIGFITTLASRLLSDVVRAFRRRYPGVELQFYDRTPAALVRGLRERALDVAFLRPPVADPALTSERLPRSELMVVLPRTHRLARRRELRWKDLSEEKFITLPDEESPGFNERLMTYAREEGFVPRSRQLANEMHTMLWMVSAGLGIAVLTTGIVDLRHRELAYRRFGPPRPTADSLLAWRAAETEPVLLAFLGVVRARIGGHTRTSVP